MSDTSIGIRTWTAIGPCRVPCVAKCGDRRVAIAQGDPERLTADEAGGSCRTTKHRTTHVRYTERAAFTIVDDEAVILKKANCPTEKGRHQNGM